jgi:hypothetical protein
VSSLSARSSSAANLKCPHSPQARSDPLGAADSDHPHVSPGEEQAQRWISSPTAEVPQQEEPPVGEQESSVVTEPQVKEQQQGSALLAQSEVFTQPQIVRQPNREQQRE